jgi:hypothetical protein
MLPYGHHSIAASITRPMIMQTVITAYVMPTAKRIPPGMLHMKGGR